MDETEAMFDAFQKAVKIAKTQAAFADAVGASQQAISYLLNRKRPLSHQYVLKAEQAFGVPREVLRPDIYERSHAAAISASHPGVACDRVAILDRVARG